MRAMIWRVVQGEQILIKDRVAHGAQEFFAIFPVENRPFVKGIDPKGFVGTIVANKEMPGHGHTGNRQIQPLGDEEVYD